MTFLFFLFSLPPSERIKSPQNAAQGLSRLLLSLGRQPQSHPIELLDESEILLPGALPCLDGSDVILDGKLGRGWLSLVEQLLSKPDKHGAITAQGKLDLFAPDRCLELGLPFFYRWRETSSDGLGTAAKKRADLSQGAPPFRELGNLAFVNFEQLSATLFFIVPTSYVVGMIFVALSAFCPVLSQNSASGHNHRILVPR